MAQSELAAKLQSEVIAAMKAKEKERLGVLRMLQAALKQVQVDERRELADDDVARILAGYGRKVKDQIKSYHEGGREDLEQSARLELQIVSEFLPEDLSEAELQEIIASTISELGASGPQDMGKVMKAVMTRTAGRADGSQISSLVKKTLAGGS